MPRPSLLPILTLTLLASPAAAAVPATLRGSPSSMVRQHEVAVEHSFTFLQNPTQVQEYVQKGRLVDLPGNPNYELANGVSFPYARPETKLFVERFAADFRQNCGVPMVVTSATRPSSMQPKNAHDLSVHPTGMAVDLRVPRESKCREWAEEALLALEKDGVLDVTLERRPPHLHIAIFPDAVQGYLAKAGPAPVTTPAAAAPQQAGTPATVAPSAPVARPAQAPAQAVQQAEEDSGAGLIVGIIGALVLLGGLLALLLRRRRPAEPTPEPMVAEEAPAATTTPLEIRVERRDRAA